MELYDVIPRLKSKKTEHKDLRITTCTDCKYGIFACHKRIWTGRGLVHDYCENQRLANEIKDAEAALSK